jgi:hypothetical protein
MPSCGGLDFVCNQLHPTEFSPKIDRKVLVLLYPTVLRKGHNWVLSRPSRVFLYIFIFHFCNIDFSNITKPTPRFLSGLLPRDVPIKIL